MTFEYLDPKESDEIRTKIIDFLNASLDDPYEQSKNVKRGEWVFGGDFKLTQAWPIIHVHLNDYEPIKVPTQSKTAYLEEERHHFIIYYYNYKNFRYTFENGEKYDNEAQCRKYLQYVKDKLKKTTQLNSYCYNITFGTIAKPKYNSATSSYVSMMPVSCTTYRR